MRSTQGLLFEGPDDPRMGSPVSIDRFILVIDFGQCKAWPEITCHCT
jgi:hypothetical protein